MERMGKVRYGQSFFREMVLASYDGRCALSEISEPELLVASHIAPWAADKERRLDPRNGLCLNSLLDRAFDRGLIAFSDDMRLLYSSGLDKTSTDKIRKMSAEILRMPSKFHPDPDLLRAHRERFECIYTQ
jgi:putative restriction endonuclease